MSTAEPFEGIEALKLDGAFLANLGMLLEEAGRGGGLRWREFGRVPGQRAQGGWRRQMVDVFKSRLARRYCFMEASPAHDRLLRGLRLRVPSHAGFWFEVLCRNAAVPIDELGRKLSEPTLDALLRHGFFARRGDLVRLPVTLVPYGDRYYLAEARHLVEHPQLYRTRPAHLSDQTHLHLEFARRFIARGGPVSLLDMGCGIGLACLELRPWCRRRVGAEISERNLMFARANAERRSDAEVVFVQSDLFANVSGRFDLITFNPWQPTEEHLPLVCRFLAESSAYLTDAGRIVLYVSSIAEAGGDHVMGQLAVTLREQGYVADRWLLRAWIDRPASRARAVSTLSALIIRRAVGDERRGGAIRWARRVLPVAYALRQALVQAHRAVGGHA